ncbi:MAG: secondary thiamine-phosphate synthase enzyme YjbQ [Thermoguttaceae bacterium]
MSTKELSGPIWLQRTLLLPSFSRGLWKITRNVLDELPELKTVQTGLLHLFLQHTSASLTLNENADPDVPQDLDRMTDHLVPESFPYQHTSEGKDDMPAHVKSSLFGVSQTIPIGQGRLLLGIWQGIFLCEHRRIPHRRTLVLTLLGQQ